MSQSGRGEGGERRRKGVREREGERERVRETKGRGGIRERMREGERDKRVCRGRERHSCSYLRAGCGLDHLQRKVQLQRPLQPLITLITHITYTTIQPLY